MRKLLIALLLVGMTTMGMAFAGGDGSSGNPYQIETCQQLQEIDGNIGTEGTIADHYVLNNDIDCSSYTGWTPINQNDNISSGSLNGQGYEVKDLQISSSTEPVGLYAYAHKVENIGLRNIQVDSENVNTGTLAGSIDRKISNVYVTGSITTTTSFSRVGGLVATKDVGGDISNVYTIVDITEENNDAQRIGGITAFDGSSTSDDNITDVYTANTYDVGADSPVDTIMEFQTQPITDAYYDSDITSETSSYGTGLTTSEMSGSSATSNMAFDFTNTWETVVSSDSDVTTDGYPILKSVNRQGQVEAQGATTITKYYTDLQPITTLIDSGLSYGTEGDIQFNQDGNFKDFSFDPTDELTRFQVEGCFGYGGTDSSSDPGGEVNVYESSSKSNKLADWDWTEFSGDGGFSCQNKSVTVSTSGGLYLEARDADASNGGSIESIEYETTSSPTNTTLNFDLHSPVDQLSVEAGTQVNFNATVTAQEGLVENAAIEVRRPDGTFFEPAGGSGFNQSEVNLQGYHTVQQTGTYEWYVLADHQEEDGQQSQNRTFQSNPIDVSTCSELDSVTGSLDYELTQDIDCSGYTGYTPNDFSGTLEGNNYTIENWELTSGSSDLGIFRSMSGEIRNLGIKDAKLVGTSGVADNTQCCGNAGIVAAELSGEIDRVFVTGSIDTYGFSASGGLVGLILNSGSVNDTYSEVEVIDAGRHASILVGSSRGDILNSYSSGVFRRSPPDEIDGTSWGAIAGDSVLDNTLTDTYWDGETTNTTRGAYVSPQEGGSGEKSTELTTAEMQGSSATTNMAGLDFQNTWTTRTNYYPQLQGMTYQVRSLDIQNPTCLNCTNSDVPFWIANTGITFGWDVNVTPDGMDYNTGIVPDIQFQFSSDVDESFETEKAYPNTYPQIDWDVKAEAISFGVSDISNNTVDINEPRHEILSISGLTNVRMVNNTENDYTYELRHELGEDVEVAPFGYTFSCSESDSKYTSDGLCESTEQGDQINYNNVATYTQTITVIGQDTSVSDSASEDITVYEPQGSYTGENGSVPQNESQQDISFTWESTEEDVTATLYFDGNQVGSETLSSGENITETVNGDVGINEYYAEVEGETSGDTYTFDTQSYEVLEPSIDISLDETSFGNRQPLADTPYYYAGSDDDPPLNVTDGEYRLDYETTQWNTTDQASYYGWLTMTPGSGTSVKTDNLVGDEIDGRTTSSSVSGTVTASFPEVNDTESFTIKVENGTDADGTVYAFTSGQSASSQTYSFSSTLDHSDNLTLAVNNSLGVEMTIEDVTFDNVEDRPRKIFSEEFRTVKVETQLIDTDDLEYWFTINGKNASGIVDVSDVNSEFMELRAYNADQESDLNREGVLATWETQNRRDVFDTPEGNNSYNADIADAPRSIIRNGNVYWFFDLNERTTEHIKANGTLHVRAGNLTDSVNFSYSSRVDFRNFRSQSDVDSLDSTLSFDSKSDLVSDGHFVSPQNPPIRIERDLDVLDVLEPVEDPNGDSFTMDRQISPSEATSAFTFRNVHSNDIGIYTNLTLGVSGSKPIEYEPDDLVNITPTSDVAGNGGWTVRDLLVQKVEVREQLVTEDQIQRELEVDGSKLERGDLTITYRLEDEFGNFRKVERGFTIRDADFRGRFYQTFDNTFELDEWIVGLGIFLLLVGGSMLYLDWKYSFLIGTSAAFGIMIGLLYSGFLPLEVNLLIMTILAGAIATIILKVIS